MTDTKDRGNGGRWEEALTSANSYVAPTFEQWVALCKEVERLTGYFVNRHGSLVGKGDEGRPEKDFRESRYAAVAAELREVLASRTPDSYAIAGRLESNDSKESSRWQERSAEAAKEAAKSLDYIRGDKKPLDVILVCPRCYARHVDSPNPRTGWTNPPHRSHLCQDCGAVWRPADVPTNGVLFIATRGKSDNWPPSPPPSLEAASDAALVIIHNDRGYPLFEKDKARCTQDPPCYGVLSSILLSGFPKGRGEYRGECLTCRRATYFDTP